MPQLIKIKGVHRDYQLGEQNVRALRGVDLEVNEGEFVALLGRSGSGKSTLLNVIGGLDRPTSGQVEVGGRELSTLNRSDLSAYRRSMVGFIFQSFHLVPRLKAWENVSLPMIFEGHGYKERRQRGLEMLERVGLSERANHRSNQLSGGEQQRVAVARAVVNQPKLLLCDEPTGNLDSVTSQEILQLITETHDEGTTVFVVTHDPDIADRYATRTLRMTDGMFAEEMT